MTERRLLPYLDWPGPIPFAHKGGAGDFPENTMAAFEHAVSLGYRHLETDVHATVDGVLLAFHDHVLDRVTDGHGTVARLPWRDLRRIRVGGTEPIVLLEDLLDRWPDVRVNIDPKHDAAVDPLVDALRRTNTVDRVCVASFSDRRIRRVRSALGPDLCTGVGPTGVAQVRAASLGVRCGPIVGACIQVPVSVGRVRVVDRRFVAAAHRRGLPVHIWTVDDPAEMQRLLDLGVDGIMTDRPKVLRAVLERRGQWFEGSAGETGSN